MADLPTSPDVRQVLTGADGKLYLTTSGVVFLAHINQFTYSSHFTNAPYHPVGQRLELAVPTAWAHSVTVTETVVADFDHALLGPLVDAMRAKKPLFMNLTGTLYRPDTGDAIESIGMVDCVPDGTIDWFAVRPGELITRAWTLRANRDPQFIPVS